MPIKITSKDTPAVLPGEVWEQILSLVDEHCDYGAFQPVKSGTPGSTTSGQMAVRADRGNGHSLQLAISLIDRAPRTGKDSAAGKGNSTFKLAGKEIDLATVAAQTALKAGDIPTAERLMTLKVKASGQGLTLDEFKDFVRLTEPKE